MAEAKKLMKPKKAKKDFETKCSKLLEALDPEIQCRPDLKPARDALAYYMGEHVGVRATNTQYNALADVIAPQFNLHFCLVQPSTKAIQQYSTGYKELTKFNPAWVGFYPSNYSWEVTIDEAGNKGNIQIDDWEQLNKLPSLNRGEKFFFAGIQYNVGNFDYKEGQNEAMGWQVFCEDKKTSQEGIYIRSYGDTLFIFNYALNTHKTRQTYGSSAVVAMLIGSKLLKGLLNAEDLPEPDNIVFSPFIEDPSSEEKPW